MLRRYSSNNLLTLRLPPRITTIGTHNCDIIVQARNVAPIHASIEYNPLTKTYFIKDHSLTNHTQVNGEVVYGQAELSNGDLVSFGDSQPLVFENETLIPVRSSTVSSGYHRLCTEKQPTERLPIIAKTPRSGRSTGSSSGQQTQRKSRDSRIISGKGKRSDSADTAIQKAQRRGSKVDVPRESLDKPGEPVGVLATGAEFRLTGNPNRIRSVGNHLLQRVVRLQSELARKDNEIRELRVGASHMGHETLSGYRNLLEQSEREKERLKELLANASDVKFGINPRMASMEEEEIRSIRSAPTKTASQLGDPAIDIEVYRTFIRTMALELQAFNDRVLRQPLRDYSDVFQAIVRALEEPFSYKLMEMESDCEAYLTELGYSDTQVTRLQSVIRDERHHKIHLMCTQLELLLPVVRDAAAIARESIRVCAVFTQWSRQLGDSIRTDGLSSETLLSSIDSLKEQFTANRMGRHWLPPSLTPLLRITALEFKKRVENIEGEKNPTDVQTQTEDIVPQEPSEIEESKSSPAKENSFPKRQHSTIEPPSTTPEQDEIVELKKELEVVTFEKHELQVAYDDLNDQYSTEVHYERNLNHSLTEEANHLRVALEDSDRKISELHNDIQTLRAQLDGAKKEKHRMERELCSEINLLHERLQDVHEPIKRIRRSLSGMSADDHGDHMEDDEDGGLRMESIPESSSDSSAPTRHKITVLRNNSVVMTPVENGEVADSIADSTADNTADGAADRIADSTADNIAEDTAISIADSNADKTEDVDTRNEPEEEQHRVEKIDVVLTGPTPRHSAVEPESHRSKEDIDAERETIDEKHVIDSNAYVAADNYHEDVNDDVFIPESAEQRRNTLDGVTTTSSKKEPDDETQSPTEGAEEHHEEEDENAVMEDPAQDVVDVLDSQARRTTPPIAEEEEDIVQEGPATVQMISVVGRPKTPRPPDDDSSQATPTPDSVASEDHQSAMESSDDPEEVESKASQINRERLSIGRSVSSERDTDNTIIEMKELSRELVMQNSVHSQDIVKSDDEDIATRDDEEVTEITSEMTGIDTTPESRAEPSETCAKPVQYVSESHAELNEPDSQRTDPDLVSDYNSARCTSSMVADAGSSSISIDVPEIESAAFAAQQAQNAASDAAPDAATDATTDAATDTAPDEAPGAATDAAPDAATDAKNESATNQRDGESTPGSSDVLVYSHYSVQVPSNIPLDNGSPKTTTEQTADQLDTTRTEETLESATHLDSTQSTARSEGSTKKKKKRTPEPPHVSEVVDEEEIVRILTSRAEADSDNEDDIQKSQDILRGAAPDATTAITDEVEQHGSEAFAAESEVLDRGAAERAAAVTDKTKDKNAAEVSEASEVETANPSTTTLSPANPSKEAEQETAEAIHTVMTGQATDSTDTLLHNTTKTVLDIVSTRGEDNVSQVESQQLHEEAEAQQNEAQQHEAPEQDAEVTGEDGSGSPNSETSNTESELNDLQMDLNMLEQQMTELHNIKENLEERLDSWNPDLPQYLFEENAKKDLRVQIAIAEGEFQKLASYVMELLERPDYEVADVSDMDSLSRKVIRQKTIQDIVTALDLMLRKECTSPEAMKLGMYQRGKKYNLIPTDDVVVGETETGSQLDYELYQSDAKPCSSCGGQRRPSQQTTEQSESSTPLREISDSENVMNTVGTSSGRISYHLQSHINTAEYRPGGRLLRLKTMQFKAPPPKSKFKNKKYSPRSRPAFVLPRMKF